MHAVARFIWRYLTFAWAQQLTPDELARKQAGWSRARHLVRPVGIVAFWLGFVLQEIVGRPHTPLTYALIVPPLVVFVVCSMIGVVAWFRWNCNPAKYPAVEDVARTAS
jgi:hypothetical protein